MKIENDMVSLMFYICAFLVSIMFFSLHKYKEQKIKKTGILLAALIPALMAGVRYNVGTDFQSYESIFTMIRSISWRELLFGNFEIPWEFGFKVLVKVLCFIGSNGFVFGVLSFIPNILICTTMCRDYSSNNLTYAYVIYIFGIFPGSFNTVRQFIALSIVFFGMKYIFEHKIIRYIAFCVFGMLFHASSIIAIPIFFIWNSKENGINRKITGMLLILFILFSASYLYILTKLSRVIPFLKKYEYLSISGSYNNRDLIVKIVIFILVLMLYKYIVKKDARFKVFVITYIISIIIGFTGFNTPYFKRATSYFVLPVILLLGTIPDTIWKRDNRVLMRSILILLSISYFVFVFYIIGDGQIFPYEFR